MSTKFALGALSSISTVTLAVELALFLVIFGLATVPRLIPTFRAGSGTVSFARIGAAAFATALWLVLALATLLFVFSFGVAGCKCLGARLVVRTGGRKCTNLQRVTDTITVFETPRQLVVPKNPEGSLYRVEKERIGLVIMTIF